ncbi:hypothetical protein AYI70_g9499 [Smittium culicis]|uniref:Uncharacterized protein n=1 Tax=Smittium culicis TaxID=133412 RepID=A0A1R1XAY0_9FUNG|nr:hypothetical protein AYI70_g9499 [Smittium culicis]
MGTILKKLYVFSSRLNQRLFKPPPFPRSLPTSPNRASLKFERKNSSSERIGIGMNRPIVDDRHTQVAAGTKIFEFLVGDFHVRQALGSPECAHTHFSNVLKAQLQVRIHSLKVNPVAFFADFPVHRPPVDDRPVISSFTVDYRDDSLTG